MKSADKKTRPEKQIRVGPAGWSYADWKGIVYPAPRPRGFHEPAYLAQYFDTIEINTSFYHPFRPNLAQGWIGQVAANPKFLFTAKLWQKFTHESGATAEDQKEHTRGLRRAPRCGTPWRGSRAVPIFISQYSRKPRIHKAHDDEISRLSARR
ncbi:MAG: DUF72 domain-containing protein [Candidatus Acidiferrales bacterium]